MNQTIIHTTVCTSCGNHFDAAHQHSTLCDTCKELGYLCTCEHCQTMFRASHAKKRFCSEACRIVSLKLNQHTCHMCRNTYTATSANQTLCSDACRQMYKGLFDYNFSLHCYDCGQPFQSHDPRTLYCSTACEANRNERFCIICATVFDQQENGQCWCSEKCKEKIKKNQCETCDTIFYDRQKKKYCSDACSKKQCRQCNEWFVPKNSSIFCSDACKKSHYTHTCKTCEKPFYKVAKKAVFCSNACKTLLAKAEKTRKVCKHCKKVMVVLDEQTQFCSSDCSIAHRQQKEKEKKKCKSDEEILALVTTRVKTLLARKNELLGHRLHATIDYYQVAGFTEALKEKILARDHHCCYVCESNEQLDIHHILPRKLGGTHDEDNLVTLCRKCHRHVETGDETHAIKKCFKQAKQHMGLPMIRLKEALSRTEQMNYLENVIHTIFEQVSEDLSGNAPETLVMLDDFIDEFHRLKEATHT